MNAPYEWVTRLPDDHRGCIAVLGLMTSEPRSLNAVTVDSPHGERTWRHGGILFTLADYNLMGSSGRALLCGVVLPPVPPLRQEDFDEPHWVPMSALEVAYHHGHHPYDSLTESMSLDRSVWHDHLHGTMYTHGQCPHSSDARTRAYAAFVGETLKAHNDDRVIVSQLMMEHRCEKCRSGLVRAVWAHLPQSQRLDHDAIRKTGFWG